VKPRRNLDERRTLRVLLAWPASELPYPTPLVERCEIALNTPLGDLDAEQIRLLIGQGFGLEYLMPKALAILERDPMIGLTFYDGDLLHACLRVRSDFWVSAPELRQRLQTIVSKLDQSSCDAKLSGEIRAFTGGAEPKAT
jgi:hypothetical protein